MILARTLRAAEQQLKRRDRKLARLIEAHGPCTLGRRRRDPFHVLCTSIINQQLSTKAADTIQARVASLLDAGDRFTPAHFVGVAPQRLREAGLSNAKARWLVDIAGQVDDGGFSFARLRSLDDEAAIAALDALPGIGRWSAEMFLIFALNRLDIFAMGDVGLRRTLDKLHNGGEKLDLHSASEITARWAPWRSVASWYLWRATDADSATWA